MTFSLTDWAWYVKMQIVVNGKYILGPALKFIRISGGSETAPRFSFSCHLKWDNQFLVCHLSPLPQNKGQTVLIEQNIKITNTDRTVSRKVVVQKPKSRHDRRKKKQKAIWMYVFVFVFLCAKTHYASINQRQYNTIFRHSSWMLLLCNLSRDSCKQAPTTCSIHIQCSRVNVYNFIM